MARSQELKNNVVVFVERCCPNSYGVVVRQPYNPLLHLGEPVVVDPRDGKKWAEKQIDWLVKQVRIQGHSDIWDLVVWVPVHLPLTLRLGTNRISHRGYQASLPIEDRHGQRGSSVENHSCHVILAFLATSEKHEERWCESPLLRGISPQRDGYEAQESSLVHAPARSFSELPRSMADMRNNKVQPQTMLSSCRIRNANHSRVGEFEVPALGQKWTAEQGSRTDRGAMGLWRVGLAQAGG